MSAPRSNDTEMRRAFEQYDRKVILNNVKIGCWIGVILMPVGVVLDFIVYRNEPDVLLLFFRLRLLCSLLICVFWAIVVTPFGHRHPRKLGITLAMFPTFFMSWMIYAKSGADSTYYAGLNLVLLVIGFVLYWTTAESVIAVILVICMYLGACWMHVGRISWTPSLLSNLFFLVLTGIIVMTGSYFHTRFRFREFALRFELDQNRAELEQTNQKLLQLDKIKSGFFANVSHELRTPLTLLLAPLEALIQGVGKRLDEDTQRMLLTMHANGMRLLKLINDLLDLVRLESGRLEVKPEPINVNDFVNGLASAVRQVAEDKRVRLDVFVSAPVRPILLDRDKLEKVLLNLLFNALKFTPSGGQVELRAEAAENRIVVIVADTGLGIEEKNLPFIFDRFWQADGSSKRKYQGVGIGLALVKEFVELMGGTVEVQSQPGKGTKFTVHLSYEPAAETAEVSSEAQEPGVFEPSTGTVASEEWLARLYRRAELFPALTPLSATIRVDPSQSGKKPSILIADDEPDMLRFLGSQLGADYRIYEAVDGQQAVEKASQFLPDLIVLDMMMPEKDGLQACREIRGNTSTQSIPVILLTARADEETKLAALSAGASDFLSKPFSTTELRVRVNNLVHSHQYQRTLGRQKLELESTLEQLKETETQLVQSEKLASLGRMSAGIIHEINNPLNYAATGLFTLRKKGAQLSPRDQVEYNEILNDVEEGITRVKTIVSDLRTFTRTDNDSRELVNLASAASAALRYTSSEWKKTVEIRQNLPEHVHIIANKNKFIQVLVNLLQNSLDAIRSKNFNGDKPTISLEAEELHGKVILRIRDNGIGIPPENRDKIFDPFFTTKEIGKGMGLGLSICYRIVEEFEGRIRLKSETGQFTEFALEFPAPATSEKT